MTIRQTGRIKIVLTQIAWFQRGWHRSDWDPQTGQAKMNGSMPIGWIATRMERPEPIGGWDLAKGDQKPVRRFVPVGAVYYLKADPKDGQAIEAWLGLGNGSISETPNGEPFEYSSLGLGHVFVGTWQGTGSAERCLSP
jgi:CRISPR-associated protein Cmr3